MPLNRMRFMNSYIDNVTMEEAIDHIEECIQQRKVGQVITPTVCRSNCSHGDGWLF